MTSTNRHVAFVVSSRDGHVRSLADAAVDAVTATGRSAKLLQVDDDRDDLQQELHQAAAVVFCSPTYLGGPTWEFVRFAEWSSTLREAQTLSSKFAAGITCGFAPEGGKTGTLHYMLNLALQHSMIWVGLPTAPSLLDYGGARVVGNAEGHRLGVGATLGRDGLLAGALATAHQLGDRLASLTER